MALFLHTALPSPTSSLALRSICPPPLKALSYSKFPHGIRSRKAISHIWCQPRASLSASDPQPSDGEDPHSRSEVPEESSAKAPADSNIFKNESANSAVSSSDPPPANGDLHSSTSSSATPASNATGSQLERDRQQDDIRQTLSTLSRSMELLSASLSEMSLAAKLLSATLDNNRPAQAASSSAGTGVYRSPTELRAAREAQAIQGNSPIDPPEPWGNTAAIAEVGGGTGGPVGEDRNRSEEDTVPLYLVEQNERAHKVAYRLQQVFFQARIEGLGKPFQVRFWALSPHPDFDSCLHILTSYSAVIQIST
jgi:hypothetical protein